MLVGQHVGPFEIEQELGSGAMGTVYRAIFNKGDNKVQVALKVVALGLLGNEQAMARFTRESTILKQLRHKHIVRLIATGRHRQTPFIAMEFIDGEPLDKALSRKGRLTWEEVAAHGKQLCSALQYAHERGIIHRDLKPSNLMVTPEGVLKLTDFGIAKDTDVTALTGANSTIGTAAYMSPEQCKGERSLTAKSDLYSLGIVFFELLTGNKPFTAENTVEMFLKHVNEPPPRPGNRVPDLPPKFEALILQLLAKDKDHRPTDAAWVARILEEIEEDAVARKSAGLDAATARRVDRPRSGDSGPIDEADRAAAMALKGTAPKKKRKKKQDPGPFFSRKWVRATGILLALAGIGVGVYLAVRPPSAAKLFAAVEAAQSPEDKLAAAEKYLAAHGDKPGDETDRAAAAFREGKVREREQQLAKRFRSKFTKPDDADDPKAFEATWSAMLAEQEGRLAEARLYWEQVRDRFPDDAKKPFALKDDELAKARWGWVAEKRLRDIKEADGRLAKLREKVRDNRRLEVPMPADPGSPESLATKALRLQEFGDADKARRVWAQAAEAAEPRPDQRAWYLLASQQRAALPPQSPPPSPEDRLARIRLVLNKVATDLPAVKDDPNAAAARRDLRQKCRDVVELYDDEPSPEIRKEVDRAKALLPTIPK
jgi:serine/threonine-protein kinase